MASSPLQIVVSSESGRFYQISESQIVKIGDWCFTQNRLHFFKFLKFNEPTNGKRSGSSNINVGVTR